MSSAPAPGLYGLLRNPPSKEDERVESDPEAQASGEHRGRALFGVQLRDHLSPPAKDGRQCIRDNNAAWVAGPGRICFVISSGRAEDAGACLLSENFECAAFGKDPRENATNPPVPVFHIFPTATTCLRYSPGRIPPS